MLKIVSFDIDEHSAENSDLHYRMHGSDAIWGED